MADVGPAPWRVASSAARAPGDRVGNTPSRSRGSGIERGGTRVDGLEVRRTTVRHRIEESIPVKKVSSSSTPRRASGLRGPEAVLGVNGTGERIEEDPAR